MVARYLAVFAFLSSAAQAEDIYVQVKSSALRSEPKYWSSQVAPLKYGDKLKKIKESNGWYQAQSVAGAKGFIHSSAITSRRVVFANTGGTQVASSSDVVLAGKGFNKDVEREYAAQNGNLNFRSVDAVESLKVTDLAVSEFIKVGKLSK
jgi:hypothetical protein